MIAGGDCQRFTGGATRLDIEATSVRRLIDALEARYAGLGAYIDRRMAICIDGEIYQDAGSAPLAPDSEVYLIPRIGGG